jgi:hypothetical protein
MDFDPVDDVEEDDDLDDIDADDVDADDDDDDLEDWFTDMDLPSFDSLDDEVLSTFIFLLDFCAVFGLLGIEQSLSMELSATSVFVPVVDNFAV